MADTSKKNKIKTYTSLLSKEMKDKVLKIFARHGTEFSTSKFITKENRDKQNIEWLEAIMDPDLYTWSVREYTQTDTLILDENDKVKTEPALKQSTILSDVCFFDALHCLAKYEAAEKTGDLNRLVVKDKTSQDTDIQHFREFAENEGLLFDKQSNLPIAVYNGIILDEDCVIDINAKKLIKRSIGNTQQALPSQNKLEKSAPIIATSEIVTINSKEIMPALQQSIERAGSQGQIEQNANKRIHKISKMGDSFALVAQKNGSSAALKFDKDITGIGYYISLSGIPFALSSFLTSTPDTSFGLLIAGAIIAGVGGFFTGFSSLIEGRNPIRAYKENGFAMPAWSLNKHVRHCRKEAQTVNSQPLSEAYNKAADGAELSIYKLKARHRFKNAAKGKGFFVQSRLNQAFRQLVAVATKQGSNAKEIETMIDEIKEEPINGYYKRRIQSDIQNQLKELERAVNHYKSEQISNLKALPAP